MPENSQIENNQPQDSQNINWKRILIAVGVAVLLIGGGVVVWLLLGNPATSLLSQTPTATPPSETSTSSAQADETADWNEYQDQRLGISFKYPKDWYLTEGEPTYVIASQKKFPTLEKNLSVSIGMGTYKKGPYDDALNYDVSKVYNNVASIPESKDSNVTIRFRNIDVDGLVGIALYTKYEEPYIKGKYVFAKNLYIKRDETYYSVGASGATKKELEEQEKIFDNLISSITFLD